MYRPLQNYAIRRLLLVPSDVKVVCETVAVVLLAGLVYRVFFKPKKYKRFPVWATIEIALASYLISRGGLSRRIYALLRRFGGSLYGLTSSHQILNNFQGVDRLMSQPYHVINPEPIQYTIFTRVLGAPDTPGLKAELENSWRDLLRPVERMFLNDSAATAALEKARVPQKAASFVTFSATTEHMEHWETSARIRVIRPDLPGQPGAVEANLESLARDFGACIAIPLIYGQDFLRRYPELLDDFWKFDNDMFPLLLIGIPSWAPFKTMREGFAARSRLVSQMEALHRRIEQYQRGELVDFDADMSDVSSAIFERNKVYERGNWLYRYRGEEYLAMLWAQNANTQPVLFWFLAYIYSTPGLVDEVREEIAPYIRLSQSNSREITSMDISALSRNCQLLKACLFETYRLAVDPTSIRYVARPITVKDGPYKHELKAGTFLSAPHALIQRDPSVYADPDTFAPRRFLEVDLVSGKAVARYGRLKPWGSGASMCKGRTFAEKEIMALGAAIISLWDIGPAGEGTWKMPAMLPGTGVKKPVKDIRVRITRRGF